MIFVLSFLILIDPHFATQPSNPSHHKYSPFAIPSGVFWSSKILHFARLKSNRLKDTDLTSSLFAISNHSRMVSHGIKLSQKQRKMIALAAKDNGSVTSSMEPSVLITTPPPPMKAAKLGNAWYVIHQIPLLFLWRALLE